MAQPRIVIVGGGFGGLAAAKALKNTPAQVILIDRSKPPLVSAPALSGGNGSAHPQPDCDADPRAFFAIRRTSR